MEITKKTIKALASDTRLEILKMLAGRRKISADIAKQLRLAPSTVNEHMKILEQAGLVKRKDTGHKWIYFEITDSGRNLVQPRSPVQFILILSLGIVMILVGGIRSILGPVKTRAFAAENVLSKTVQSGDAAGAPEVAQSVPVDWIVVFLVAAGLALAVMGIYNLVKIRQAYKN